MNNFERSRYFTIMDNNQIQYLIEIVNSKFHLTTAAKKLYVTQSALSQFIKKFELEQGFEMFSRRNGRIVGLTSSGMRVYQSAKIAAEKLNLLSDVIENESAYQKGMVRIGIHPTILRLFFRKFIPQFMLDHSDARIEIVEAGTVELREMLLNETIHMALLMDPTELDKDKYEDYQLIRTEVAAFMNPNHPLSKKRILNWNLLENYPYVTYNNKDSVYHLVKQKLNDYNVENKFLFTSSSWDYMIESAAQTEIVAILPTVYFTIFKERLAHIGVIEKRFEDPVPYVSMLVRPLRKRYSKVENFVFNSILEYFYSDDYTLKYDFRRGIELDQ